MKFLVLVLENIRHNAVRTVLTSLGTMMLVLVVTLVFTVLTTLDRVATEKSSNIKAIVTEKWQNPSLMPYAYASGLAAGAANPNDPDAAKPQDSMTWGFFVGSTESNPAKMGYENLFFSFIMEPEKARTMLDSIDELTDEQALPLIEGIKKIGATRNGVIVGEGRLTKLKRKVGDRITVFGRNYKDINLELEIVGTFPKITERYADIAIIRRDFFETELDTYKAAHNNKPHALADKSLSLVWLRVPDKATFNKVTEQILTSPSFTNPAVKCETSSTAISSFLDAYRDILWGIRWLLAPACMLVLSLVISNAISISVRERRTEFAVLKVLGYLPVQILSLVLGEAILVGTLSGLASAGLAYLIINGVWGGLPFPIAFFPKFAVPISCLWWGAAMGAATALAGSFSPPGRLAAFVFPTCFRRSRDSSISGRELPLRFVSVVLDEMMFVMFDSLLIAAAPWQVFGQSSPVLKGIFAGAAILLVVLLAIGKVPLNYNLMNLATRWLTTFYTVCSFTLVIAIQIMLLAFVNGMYAMTESSGQPGNVLILSDGSTDEAFSNLGFADGSEIETQDGIARDENGRALVSRETYLGISQQMIERGTGRQKRRFLQVRGVDDPAMSVKVHGRKLIPGGEYFSDSGVREINSNGETAIEAMLGEAIARELSNDRTDEMLKSAKRQDRLDVGDTFKIGERVWYVTGILESTNTVYDSEVWTRQSQAGPLFGKSNYTTFCVRARPDFRKDQRAALLAAREQSAQLTYDDAVKLKQTDPTAPTPKRLVVRHDFTEEQWGAELLKEYFATEYKKAAVSPQVEQTYFANLSATNVQFLGMAIIVACIMSLGGLFGVMNTMFAAISQRTKDIGVLRLLGFQRWQILVSFLLESLVLALVGGAAGCAIGMLCNGFTANSIVTGGPGGGGKFVVLRLTVDASTIAVGMMLALAMGFFGGLIPAVSAMRLSALKALR